MGWERESGGPQDRKREKEKTKKEVKNFTFPVKEIRAVLPRKRNLLGELAHKLHDLSDMVIVLAVPRSRRRIKQIITTRQKFEYLSDIGKK